MTKILNEFQFNFNTLENGVKTVSTIIFLIALTAATIANLINPQIF